MIYRSVLLASLVSLAVAQDALAPIAKSDGILLPGPDYNPAATEFFLDAGRSPKNASKAVYFNRNDNNTSRGWTWSLAVSDLKVPSPIDTLGTESANYSGNFHITNSQWKLAWNPSTEWNQTLLDFLRERKLTMKVIVQQSIPSSEQLARYSGSNDGNCTALLGAECEASLRSAGSFGSTVTTAALRACNDIFFPPTPGVPVANVFEVNPSRNNTYYPIERAQITPGSSIYYTNSDSYQAGNLTVYNRTLASLNILVIGFSYNQSVPAEERVAIAPPSVLCQVVDKTRASSAASGALPGWVLLFAGALSVVIATL